MVNKLNQLNSGEVAAGQQQNNGANLISANRIRVQSSAIRLKVGRPEDEGKLHFPSDLIWRPRAREKESSSTSSGGPPKGN